MVSGLCMGGNPFSGFSHQNGSRDREMTEYYTPEIIRKTLRLAEQSGINTFFARTDDHVMGIIRDYRKAGGKLQWFAQISVDSKDQNQWVKLLKDAIAFGATGTYIHGGIVDFWYANRLFDNFHEALGIMRNAGVAAGFAGHQPEAHEWIRDNLKVDFQMCSYYNPTDRSKSAGHISVGEKWLEQDRKKMLRVIATIKTPVVHYKVFAAGNKPVLPAFKLLGKTMRKNDVVCIGMFLKDDPDMIAKNIANFEKHVDRVK